MKKLLLSVVAAFFIVFQTSATSISVSGNISSNTTWSGVDTVKVTGDVTVDQGYTLTIEAGIVVEFQGHYYIDVRGMLNAEGTTSDTIYFTPVNSSTGWNRILFNNVSGSSDSSVFEYCKFTGGKATGTSTDGGAVYVSNFSLLRFSHCLFNDNYAQQYGGAVYIEGCNPVFSRCTFDDNESGTGGGAVYNKQGYPDFSLSLFKDNNGNTYGGAFYMSYSKLPYVNNCLFYDNTATYGGAFYIEGGTVGSVTGSFKNNTFTSNTPDAVHLDNDADPDFYSSLFYNNTTTQITLNTLDNDPNFYYCDIQGGSSSFSGSGASGYSGTYSHCIDSDPLFVGSGNHPYDLSSNSPCINQGNPGHTVSDLGE